MRKTPFPRGNGVQGVANASDDNGVRHRTLDDREAREIREGVFGAEQKVCATNAWTIAHSLIYVERVLDDFSIVDFVFDLPAIKNIAP